MNKILDHHFGNMTMARGDDLGMLNNFWEASSTKSILLPLDRRGWSSKIIIFSNTIAFFRRNSTNLRAPSYPRRFALKPIISTCFRWDNELEIASYDVQLFSTRRFKSSNSEWNPYCKDKDCWSYEWFQQDWQKTTSFILKLGSSKEYLQTCANAKLYGQFLQVRQIAK